MEKSGFRFKQFSVRHDRCAMKVGTDGVLLGAWCDISGSKRILDVGTGTGLIALMIAQRSPANIVALEIDADAVLQAKENVSESPWKDRIEIVAKDFRDYIPEIKFDLIVSNPPYFIDSLKCLSEQRTIARHNQNLSYYELIKGVVQCLERKGRFCIVIPTDVSEAMEEMAAGFGLYSSKKTHIITTPGKRSKRVLLEFVFDPDVKCSDREFLIEEQRHQYSAEYIELTKAYYLNM